LRFVVIGLDTKLYGLHSRKIGDAFAAAQLFVVLLVSSSYNRNVFYSAERSERE